MTNLNLQNCEWGCTNCHLKKGREQCRRCGLRCRGPWVSYPEDQETIWTTNRDVSCRERLQVCPFFIQAKRNPVLYERCLHFGQLCTQGRHPGEPPAGGRPLPGPLAYNEGSTSPLLYLQPDPYYNDAPWVNPLPGVSPDRLR